MTIRTGWTRRFIRAFALLVCAAAVATSTAGSAGYHRIMTIKLGGQEGWDYLTFDSASHIHTFRAVFQHVSVPQFQVTVTLAEQAGKTKLTRRMLFESVAACDKVKRFAVEANEQNLDRLAAQLAKMV